MNIYMLNILINIIAIILFILFVIVNAAAWKDYKKEVKKEKNLLYKNLSKSYKKCFDKAGKLISRSDISFKERNELYNSFIDLYSEIESVGDRKWER